MAVRPAWTIKNNSIIRKDFGFEWNGGFAVSQKRKNITNLHNSIMDEMNQRALEVSSKSEIDIGRQIGAFELKYDGVPLENIFQSSKKYEFGGPYLDLLEVPPKEAKRDERHKNSGSLKAFYFHGVEWPLLPRTIFYDYIYVKAVLQRFGSQLDLSDYEWFTDIEFNPQKSTNCQARSAAIYKLLQIENYFNILNNFDEWMQFHKSHVVG